MKVRLRGLETDVKEFAALLRELEVEGRLRILDESADYADRAPSLYRRRYLDVEMREGNKP